MILGGKNPYSTLKTNASRPNTTVNICIGALIIEEIFGISDDELVENLMLDPRYTWNLSRIELLYTGVSKLVIYLNDHSFRDGICENAF